MDKPRFTFCVSIAKKGTIWDDGETKLQRMKDMCEKPSDSNFDGCVQLNDLLSLNRLLDWTILLRGACSQLQLPWQCGDAFQLK